MTRAQRRLSERQQAKAERSQAKRAVAFERRSRQRERWAGASQTSVLSLVGGLLWELAAAQLAVLVAPLYPIGRLMGIDTSETGPPRKRPAWMPAPDPQAAEEREHGGTGQGASSVGRQ